MNRTSQFLAKVGQRLLLLAGSLLVALVVIEIILRVIGYSPAVSSPLTSFHQADERLGWIEITGAMLILIGILAVQFAGTLRERVRA